MKLDPNEYLDKMVQNRMRPTYGQLTEELTKAALVAKATGTTVAEVIAMRSELLREMDRIENR